MEALFEKLSSLNHELNLELLAARGQSDELLRSAADYKDWEKVMSIHIEERNTPAALDVLRGVRRERAEAPAEVERLLGLTSHELLELEPAGTVAVWLMARFVDAGKLLPAVLSYDRRIGAGAVSPPEHEGIKFLCGSGSERTVVHNGLVLLHARRSDDTTLLRYLSGVPSDGDRIASADNGSPTDADPAPAGAAIAGLDDVALTVASAPSGPATPQDTILEDMQIRPEFSPPPYDLDYAARTCIAHERFEACVFLYQATCQAPRLRRRSRLQLTPAIRARRSLQRMQLYEEAVDLALKMNRLALAKRSANLQAEPSARKKLWLQIARSAIQRDAERANDAQQANTAAGGLAHVQTARQLRESVRTAAVLLSECNLLRIEASERPEREGRVEASAFRRRPIRPRGAPLAGVARLLPRFCAN